MRLALKLHPDSTCAAASTVDVEVTRPSERTVALSYIVTGKASGLLLPRLVAPVRADELWRHTCFEAFFAAPPDTGYYELNFSPSTEWAAYRFSGYRNGMQTAFEIEAPQIESSSSPENYTLRVTLDLTSFPHSASGRLGLSAVIEEINGNKSYWALAHAPGKPDFHRADCFTHEFS